MRSSASAPAPAKTCASAASKISRVIDELFLPMVGSALAKPHTSFTDFEPLDTSLVDFVALQAPALVQSKSVFLAHFDRLYERWLVSG